MTTTKIISRKIRKGSIAYFWAEIELEENAEAVLLSLSIDKRKEKSSDGREEMEGTPTLSLGGIRQIKLSDPDKASEILKC